MGNPAWGHGYHQGFGDGAKRGSLITGAAALAVGGVIYGAKWGYNMLKQRRVAEYERSERAEEEALSSGEDGLGEVII